MKSIYKWKIVLVVSVLLLFIYTILFILRIRSGVNLQDTIRRGITNNTNEEMKLPIPPILEDLNPDDNIADFKLTVQKSSKEFINGKTSETYGYNGDYLGPVVRVKKGDQVNFRF